MESGGTDPSALPDTVPAMTDGVLLRESTTTPVPRMDFSSQTDPLDGTGTVIIAKDHKSFFVAGGVKYNANTKQVECNAWLRSGTEKALQDAIDAEVKLGEVAIEHDKTKYNQHQSYLYLTHGKCISPITNTSIWSAAGSHISFVRSTTRNPGGDVTLLTGMLSGKASVLYPKPDGLPLSVDPKDWQDELQKKDPDKSNVTKGSCHITIRPKPRPENPDEEIVSYSDIPIAEDLVLQFHLAKDRATKPDASNKDSSKDPRKDPSVKASLVFWNDMTAQLNNVNISKKKIKMTKDKVTGVETKTEWQHPESGTINLDDKAWVVYFKDLEEDLKVLFAAYANILKNANLSVP